MIFPGSRNQLGHWLNSLGLMGQGVEVGVYRGEFSERILSTWSGVRLWCVDSWDEGDQDSRHPVTPQEDALTETRRRLFRFGDRQIIVRGKSLAVASEAPDATFDFVYIDAKHDYASAAEDIKAWFPKVKGGGILCGDDFTHEYPDVGRAVVDFALARKLPLSWCGSLGSRTQWYIRK